MRYVKKNLPNRIAYILSLCLVYLTCNGNTPTTPIGLEQAYLQLAQALTAQNQQTEALTYYKKTIEQNPHNQEALYQLGTTFFKKNEYTEAVSYLEQYAALNNTNIEVLNQLHTAYAALVNREKSIYYQQQVIALQPTELGYLQLGNLFLQQGNFPKAIESYNNVLTINPKNSQAYLNKAQTLEKNSHIQEAIDVYDQLLALYKNHPQSLLGKAALLVKRGDTEAALSLYQQLQPYIPAQKKASLLYAMGTAHRKGGRLTQAQELFQTILNQNPNYTHAILGLAKTKLTLGQYPLGWQLMAHYNQLANPHEARLLTNRSHIKGKKIFIGAEWILEDMVQLVRYAKTIHDEGGSVIMQTPPQLEALFKACPFIDKVVGFNENLSPAYHAYIPITSLPALFQTTMETIPNTLPYLLPPQDLVTHWHNLLKHDSNFKVGICWKKNEQQVYDPAERTSIPFSLFAPLAKIPGLSVYCLQQVTEQESVAFSYHDLITLCGKGFNEDNDGLIELAALMKNLDLIITLDCCVAHVAGALGTHVWTLLPTRADYRWLAGRLDYPWYPTMRLFRQKDTGDWKSVLNCVIKEVTLLLQTDKKASHEKNL